MIKILRKGMLLTKYEREIRLKEIIAVAKKTNEYPNKVELAKKLGITRETLVSDLKRLNIDYKAGLYKVKEVKKAIDSLKEKKISLTQTNIIKETGFGYLVVKYCCDYLGIEYNKNRTSEKRHLKKEYYVSSLTSPEIYFKNNYAISCLVHPEKYAQIEKEKRELKNHRRRRLRKSRAKKPKGCIMVKIKNAISELEKEGIRVNISSIFRKTKLARETIRKYISTNDLKSTSVIIRENLSKFKNKDDIKISDLQKITGYTYNTIRKHFPEYKPKKCL